MREDDNEGVVFGDFSGDQLADLDHRAPAHRAAQDFLT